MADGEVRGVRHLSAAQGMVQHLSAHVGLRDGLISSLETPAVEEVELTEQHFVRTIWSGGEWPGAVRQSAGWAGARPSLKLQGEGAETFCNFSQQDLSSKSANGKKLFWVSFGLNFVVRHAFEASSSGSSSNASLREEDLRCRLSSGYCAGLPLLSAGSPNVCSSLVFFFFLWGGIFHPIISAKGLWVSGNTYSFDIWGKKRGGPPPPRGRNPRGARWVYRGANLIFFLPVHQCFTIPKY